MLRRRVRGPAAPTADTAPNTSGCQGGRGEPSWHFPFRSGLWLSILGSLSFWPPNASGAGRLRGGKSRIGARLPRVSETFGHAMCGHPLIWRTPDVAEVVRLRPQRDRILTNSATMGSIVQMPR